ncbi:TlyA family RNA methyltransferase [Thermanaeromonas sp. C210]|uniref:TlyA family RNA methyltransferase n=1 Tax=Thermanaeromonas sp. C210 TaxID=2731925 RepID=UPI00155BD28C|nr:TlyA family RNA methyltransferase [Thermanaeromonas sp. C210]GFN23331.1 TlyA family rRNA (cytidine-2'-O)-methyltransferase [Thermanaeromonas sp. C210]
MAKARKRLDVLLVERGLFPTREQARKAIMAGEVLVNGQALFKPGSQVGEEAEIKVLASSPPYVSRGGLKLEGALHEFAIDPSGRVALDAGASTGGFTDCLLKHGARRVHAVDVGYGQLDWRLRQDPRVVVHERVNLRYLTPEILGERVDLATLDLSFISLSKVWPAVRQCLLPRGEVIALVKPQFEAGPERVGKKGVVRDPGVHRQVLLEVCSGARAQGFSLLGITYSPLLGPEGNREFFLWLAVDVSGLTWPEVEALVPEVVSRAHEEVKRRRE